MAHVDTADMDLPPLIQEKNGSPFELWNEKGNQNRWSTTPFFVL
jgi:hypothetical protein